jgi:hypothetical protein
MSKYLFVYRGPATPMTEFTPEESAAQMEAWGKWMSEAGSSLADPGAPFAARTAVTDDSSAATPGDLSGYSIVQADNLDAAVALTKGHPFLSEGKGRFIIEIFELAPM